MALIKCKECEKEYSDKAEACPNCSCPTISNTITEKRKNTKSCNVEILGEEKLTPKPKYYNITIILIIGLFIFIEGFRTSYSEYQVLFDISYDEAKIYGWIPIIFGFIVLVLSPILAMLFPEYKLRVKNAKKINSYFKERFLILDSLPNTFNDKLIVNKQSSKYEDAMFDIYMEAYKFDADAIIINDSNVSTHAQGSVSTSVFSKNVSGRTTSTNTFHITATLVKY